MIRRTWSIGMLALSFVSFPLAGCGRNVADRALELEIEGYWRFAETGASISPAAYDDSFEPDKGIYLSVPGLWGIVMAEVPNTVERIETYVTESISIVYIDSYGRLGTIILMIPRPMHRLERDLDHIWQRAIRALGTATASAHEESRDALARMSEEDLFRFSAMQGRDSLVRAKEKEAGGMEALLGLLFRNYRRITGPEISSVDVGLYRAYVVPFGSPVEDMEGEIHVFTNGMFVGWIWYPVGGLQQTLAMVHSLITISSSSQGRFLTSVDSMLVDYGRY